MFLKAMEYYGLEEVPGTKHNPQIIKFAASTIATWVHKDETGWCSTFMNHCAYECSCERSYMATAKSWLETGKRVKVPEIGHLVVFWRVKKNSWQGHVGLYAGLTPQGDIYTLGGNQNNKVCIIPYAKKFFLAYIELPFI